MIISASEAPHLLGTRATIIKGRYWSSAVSKITNLPHPRYAYQIRTRDGVTYVAEERVLVKWVDVWDGPMPKYDWVAQQRAEKITLDRLEEVTGWRPKPPKKSTS